MEYRSLITPKMVAIAKILTDTCAGMDYCISAIGNNLIVEVPKSKCDTIKYLLKPHFIDVALMRNALLMIEDLHDFILVKPLVSEAPVREIAGVTVPQLEKLLVDHSADKEYSLSDDNELQRDFQRAFELYTVNTSRLLRYAGRKGKKEEIRLRVDRVDKERIDIVHTIQEYFRQEPVRRAWLFGSFSRMEERPDSDIDILVDLDQSVPIGLLSFSGMMNNLEKLLGRKVDLVAEGSIKPFARESINRDKVLVYERA